jgi:formiminotetrahydrofolate cyclodeaminase
MSTPMRDQPIHAFLEDLAVKSPTPGGGAVAALAAAIGAAQASMVIAYTEGKEKYAEHEELLRETGEDLERYRRDALQLAEDDKAAYEELSGWFRRDRQTVEDEHAHQAAVRRATEVPQRLLDRSVAMLELLELLCGRTNRMLASDLAIAAILGECAARSAAWNVRINLPQWSDAVERADATRDLARQLARAAKSCAAIERACSDGC